MKQSLRPSRSASPSIDYPGPRVYGCLSPDDQEPECICETCGADLTSEHPGYPYSCPECTKEKA